MPMGDRIIGQCSQAEFTAAGLVKITGARPEEIGRLLPLCLQRKLTPGNGINVEVALGVIALAGCMHLNATAEQLAPAQGPLVYAALTYLASNPQQWKASGDDAELARFRDLFFECDGAGARRMRLLSLLGIGDRKMHRFLVRRPHEPWSVSDDYDERVGARKEPWTVVLDAEAIATLLAEACPVPLFSWSTCNRTATRAEISNVDLPL